jgi:GTP-binding protein EngB required for normal cell division
LTVGSIANDFNESHRRRLLANAQRADQLLSEIEEILAASESKAAFPRYRADLPLHQARLVRASMARFRDHLVRALPAVGIEREGARFSSLHSIKVTLNFVRIAVQEMAPEHLRGYGELSDDASALLRGICGELEGLIDGLERGLHLGEAGLDLQSQLAELDGDENAGALRALYRVIEEEDLFEYRPRMQQLVTKARVRLFEVAVFGRVSSGKSSLLNHFLGTEVLPVGVNPITAVPTRLVYSNEDSLKVTLTDRSVQQRLLSDLPKFASEEENPGNELGVTRLVVGLNNSRLQEGLMLVDTPGLGSLARAGAGEALAYLPECDLGIVLISAVNPINSEDLDTIAALSEAGIPVMGLLSKADLLSPADRSKATAYIQKQVSDELGTSFAVCAVSSVSNDDELTRGWFEHQLAPLLARHRELVAESIRAKTAALRNSVIAALRSRLGGVSAPAAAGASIEAIEERLRLAAGTVEEARRHCLGITDDIRSLTGAAIETCVDTVLMDGQGAEAMFNRVVTKLASEAAGRIPVRLGKLACDLQSALDAASRVLDDSWTGQERPLESLVREMPRFELSLAGANPSRRRPAWPRFLLARQLRADLGPSIERSFGSYGRTLELWVQNTVGLLREGFETQADGYRAQLARMQSAKALPPEQSARVRGHLAEMEGLGCRG